MSNAYATTTPAEDAAMRHAVTFANVFTQAALDTAYHGIRPEMIHVDTFSWAGHLTVTIQITGSDTTAVDTLGELYGLADPEPGGRNYTRIGHTVIAADTVAVRVYCRRPAQVVA